MSDGAVENAAGVQKKVFSLWPAPQDPGAIQDAMPAWTQDRTSAAVRRGRLTRSDVAAGTLLVAMAALAAVGVLSIERSTQMAALCGLAIMGAAYVCLVWLGRRRELAAALSEDRWRDALFERSGISLWREDWTPVGRAIMVLKLAGVHDIQAHFAARPDEARALRRAVIVKDVNAFTVQMMGAPSKAALVGSLDKLLPESDQTFDQWLIAFGRGDAFYRSETHIVRPDGAHVDVLFTAALPTSLDGFSDILVTALDVTEYKALQSRLVTAETEAARVSRISTMGALTASITHEINTPLASILANVEAALRWLGRKAPNLDEAQQALRRAVGDAARTQEVVARTRSFLDAKPPAVERIDMTQTAQIALVLIDRELRAHNVAAHLDAAEDLPPVEADPIQLQQVFVNLLINGAQAMKSTMGARDLTVTIRQTDGGVQVTVADTGPGISPAALPRLFDAFASDKTEGMGMGLAICRSCVEAHNGRIWADSAPGQGARFHFVLPVVGHVPRAFAAS